MPEILSTLLILALIACALFFSIRKLWRDKKSGKSCCGGYQGCSGCSRCSEKSAKEKTR